MQYILRDGSEWGSLLPITYTRSVADVRLGILTLREKWEKRCKSTVQVLNTTYLGIKYTTELSQDAAVLINSAVLCDDALFHAVSQLQFGQRLVKNGKEIARCAEKNVLDSQAKEDIEYTGEVVFIAYPWDIFSNNKKAIADDFELITSGRKSQEISSTNTVLGNGKIFLEEGAKVEASILNTTDGPIYLAAGAEIMEGSIVRGGLSLGEGSQLKLGTKIYGPTTIGPHCKVGGEVNNSVITGYSNKAHDGFLGNSVIGEWCNLGADTNNSNLKNNYGMVKVFSPEKGDYINTGLQFCGLLMGDHSKCGINTMLNTGTVVGVNANIFGGGFPSKHIASFSWGGAEGFETFDLEKSFEVSERVMSRRGLPFTDTDKEIMRHIFKLTAGYRS
jgi:UDP-N-acetylglucosamine diphosphorylase/glucosamine-1-phosphate N-acetyltransferase